MRGAGSSFAPSENRGGYLITSAKKNGRRMGSKENTQMKKCRRHNKQVYIFHQRMADTRIRK